MGRNRGGLMETQEPTTLEVVKEAVRKLRQLKRRKDRIARIEKKCSEQYEAKRQEVANMLEAEDLERFDYEDTVVLLNTKTSYCLDPLNREPFFEWLKSRDLDDLRKLTELVPLNSTSLQAFVKQEIESGAELIPGIVVNEYTQLSIRGK